MEPEALRGTPPGVGEIVITGELDGPIKGFGERVSRLLNENAPPLATLLSSPMRLLAIEYSDRYLASPLSRRIAGRRYRRWYPTP